MGEVLNTSWVLWYHFDVTAWKVENFRVLVTMDTVEDVRDVFLIIQENPVMILEHLYVMRKGITPRWEDPCNRKGGCWSMKVDIKESFQVFVKTVIMVVSENSLSLEDGTNRSDLVTGISLCQKNNYNSILQVWNSDRKVNKVSYLPQELTSKFTYEIIYRPHITEDGV